MVAGAVDLPVVPPDRAVLEVLQRRIADSGFQILRPGVLVQTELPAGSAVHPASTRSFAKQPALQRHQTSLFTVPEGHNLRPLCVNRRSYHLLVAAGDGLPLVGVRGLGYLDFKEIPFALATQGTHSPPSVAYALPCGHTPRLGR